MVSQMREASGMTAIRKQTQMRLVASRSLACLPPSTAPARAAVRPT